LNDANEEKAKRQALEFAAHVFSFYFGGIGLDLANEVKPGRFYRWRVPIVFEDQYVGVYRIGRGEHPPQGRHGNRALRIDRRWVADASAQRAPAMAVAGGWSFEQSSKAVPVG
jgi:hypothetical protein